MFVCNYMTSDVITIPPTASVEDALHIMQEKNVQHLPILDFDGKLLGMVSDRDLLLVSPSPTAALTIHEMLFALSNLKVSEIMPEGMLTVGPQAPLEEAARTMIDNKLDALPVLDGGRLVGIITEDDIFRTFMEFLSVEQPAVQVTLLIPDVQGVIAYLCRQISAAGGTILNLGTFGGRAAGTRTVTANVSDLPMSHIRELMQRAEEDRGCQLVDVRLADVSSPAGNQNHRMTDPST
jgi:acetoin utilization protein AcuB